MTYRYLMVAYNCHSLHANAIVTMANSMILLMYCSPIHSVHCSSVSHSLVGNCFLQMRCSKQRQCMGCDLQAKDIYSANNQDVLNNSDSFSLLITMF